MNFHPLPLPVISPTKIQKTCFFYIVCFHHPGFFRVSASGRSGHRWNKEAEQGSASAGNFGTTHLAIKYQADLYLEFGFSVARDSTNCKINGVTRFQATLKSTIWWNYDSWPSQLTPNVLEFRRLDFHEYVYFELLLAKWKFFQDIISQLRITPCPRNL